MSPARGLNGHPHGGLSTDFGERFAGSSARVDMTRPAAARRYDYLLGGKEHFTVNRESAEAIAERFPTLRQAVLENRRFLHRVVRYLAAEAGVDQFLDIGTGIPTAANVHQLAQDIHPTARVIYVDNDPLVMAHARVLLTGAAPSQVGYIEADLRHPEEILRNHTLHRILDLNRPVALLLVAVLHFIDDSDRPAEQVARLMAALPPGSYLAISHVSFDLLPAGVAADLEELNTPEAGHGTFRPRTRTHIEEFLGSLHPTAPGLVPINDWRPAADPRPQATPAETGVYGAVAHKP